MTQFVLFLHALGALTVGFYLLFPFLAYRVKGLEPPSLAGYVRGLGTLNRIGQWLLLVQLVTGGYLIGQYDLSSGWNITVLALMVLLFAVTGMLAGPLKRIAADAGGGKDAAAADASKVTAFGTAAAVLVLALLALMYFTF